MTDMKQRDLKKCYSCGNGVMHEGVPVFYRFRMDTMGIQADAVRQQHGMEIMMGAAAPIAQMLGPDEVMAKEIDTKDFVLCHSCMMNCNAGTFIGGASDG